MDCESLANSEVKYGINLYESPYCSHRFIRPLLVGTSLALFQQITGQPSVIYYANSIFEAAGFKEGKNAAGAKQFLLYKCS